jgi:transposase
MGEDTRKKILDISREQVLELYAAGPEAVVGFIEHIQNLINGLGEKIEAQQKIIEQQEERIKSQEERIQELEGIIKKDSHTSSKPPSSDGYAKRGITPKKKSGKSPGGQRGHEGNTLRMVANPDTIVVHRVERCRRCGRSLRTKSVLKYDRRQVFEIPPLKVEVTEHRAEMKACEGCGEVSVADFPKGITHKVQYGERLKAYAVYIKNYGLLSYERAAELFEDLFSVPLSAGTLVRVDRVCAERLAEVEQRIKEHILDSPVVHFDETGMRVEGKLQWLHVASTKGLTYYAAHEKRGKDAADEICLLPQYRGRAVHDGWRSYFGYGCEHALCNAHHLRELSFIFEQYGQKWAREMKEILLEIKERRDKTKRGRFGPETIGRYEKEYRRIIAAGMRANPPPAHHPGGSRRGRRKKSDALNLLERLKQYERETLAFMYDFSVPFDNNQGERDLRMMKVQQKISGTFRSSEGARTFCRIRSYISTVKKQGMNVISAIHNAFSEKALLPQLA